MAHDVERIVAVARRVGAGSAPAAVAAELGISEDLVREDMRAIVAALPSPRHQWTSAEELRRGLMRKAEKIRSGD